MRRNDSSHAPGDFVHTAVRGEKITVRPYSEAQHPAETGIPASVTALNFAGGVMRITADASGTPVTAIRYGLDTSISVGQRVLLTIEPEAGVLVRQ